MSPTSLAIAGLDSVLLNIRAVSCYKYVASRALNGNEHGEIIPMAEVLMVNEHNHILFFHADNGRDAHGGSLRMYVCSLSWGLTDPTDSDGDVQCFGQHSVCCLGKFNQHTNSANSVEVLLKLTRRVSEPCAWSGVRATFVLQPLPSTV